MKRSGVGGAMKAPDVGVLARRWRVPREAVEALLAAAQADGALVVHANGWALPGWDEYQKPDATAAERMRKHRAGDSAQKAGVGLSLGFVGGGQCNYCGATEDLTLDHIRPASKGGKNEPSNYQILCRTCNSSKRGRDDTGVEVGPNSSTDGVRVTRNATEQDVTRHATETLTGTETGNPGRRRARTTALPDGWTPNDVHREIAQAEGVALAREETAFRDHALATGRTLRDWDAGFRTWLRKAKAMAPRPQAPRWMPPDREAATPRQPLYQPPPDPVISSEEAKVGLNLMRQTLQPGLQRAQVEVPSPGHAA